MKTEIPVVAISIHDISAYNPSEFPGLLSDTDLVLDLIVDINDLKSNQEGAYLLILEDQKQQKACPVYAKQYEFVIPSKKDIKKEGNIKYCKTAEYSYDDFEVKFDDDEFPISIIVNTQIN